MKPTAAQRAMLESVRDTGDAAHHVKNRAHVAGAGRTIRSLLRLDLVKMIGRTPPRYELTDAGKEALGLTAHVADISPRFHAWSWQRGCEPKDREDGHPARCPNPLGWCRSCGGPHCGRHGGLEAHLERSANKLHARKRPEGA